MIIVICLLVVICYIIWRHDKTNWKVFESYQLSATKVLDLRAEEAEGLRAYIASLEKLGREYEKLVAAKDNSIKTYETQVEQLKEVIDNMSELKGEVELEEDEDEEATTEEYPELVLAHPLAAQLLTIHEQRVLKVNSILALYEAGKTLDANKNRIPKDVYDKLAAHFRQDS